MSQAGEGPLEAADPRVDALEARNDYEGHWRAAALCSEIAADGSRSRGDRQCFAKWGIENAAVK